MGLLYSRLLLSASVVASISSALAVFCSGFKVFHSKIIELFGRIYKLPATAATSICSGESLGPLFECLVSFLFPGLLEPKSRLKLEDTEEIVLLSIVSTVLIKKLFSICQ